MSAINRHKYFRDADGRVRRVMCLLSLQFEFETSRVCAYVCALYGGPNGG